MDVGKRRPQEYCLSLLVDSGIKPEGPRMGQYTFSRCLRIFCHVRSSISKSRLCRALGYPGWSGYCVRPCYALHCGQLDCCRGLRLGAYHFQLLRCPLNACGYRVSRIGGTGHDIKGEGAWYEFAKSRSRISGPFGLWPGCHRKVWIAWSAQGTVVKARF